MVQLSSKRIDEETLIKLKGFLFYLLNRASSKEKFFSIIGSIFSETEILMILKRLGIIYLLLIGIQKYKITQTLGVTRSTIDKFSLIIEKNNDYYEYFKKLINKEKVKLLFEDLINTLYSPGTPGVNWSEAWKTKREIERKKEEGI